MQTRNPQTIFQISGNERFKLWNTLSGFVPNIKSWFDFRWKKKSHSENNINNNSNKVIFLKNLLTYINVFMENSLNESEENSQSCPAKTWFLWQM